MTQSRHVLLDRDGVINRRIPDGYVTTWQDFEFLPRTLDALRLLTESSCQVVVVSNQAGVGKGLITLEGLEEITRRFVVEAEKHGGRIAGVYYCLHREEEECECRKPKPGLLLQAQRDHGFQFADTFFVGDSETDLRAAQCVGCPTVLVGSREARAAERWGYRPGAIVPDLHGAVQFVLGLRSRRLTRIKRL